MLMSKTVNNNVSKDSPIFKRVARRLAGSAVAFALEEQSRYLESGSVARQWF